MSSDLKSIGDLQAIRKIMEESSRFLSLSGLAGVFAGLTAIAGALFAFFVILDNGAVKYDDYLNNLPVREASAIRWQLIADALVVLLASLLFGLYFSLKKAHREGKHFMTPISRRMMINLFIPLLTGGIFIIVLILQNDFHLVVPCTLIFYGLALVNAGKFTYGEVFYLGLLEIITGLLSAFLSGWGIIFWIIGFGILHIIYGVAMYRKYEA